MIMKCNAENAKLIQKNKKKKIQNVIVHYREKIEIPLYKNKNIF